MINKKIITIFLSLILLLDSFLFAGVGSQLNEFFNNAQLNITKPSISRVTTDTGRKEMFVYTGGVSFSFNNSYPEPIFAVTPPTIEAGCNGLNIKGMFIALLGLDQLGNMLKNAGASLAWGVAIGIVYSLPGVASAFKMINQWAKDLQKLLGNACQSGINIGQYLVKQTGFDKEAIEAKINSMIPDAIKCKQEGENCIVQALGLSKYFDKNGIFNYGGSNQELDPKEKKNVIIRLYKGIFEADMSLGAATLSAIVRKDKGKRLINSLFGGDHITNSKLSTETKTFGLTFDSASGGNALPIKDVIGALSETEKTKSKIALTAIIFNYNFVGDLITEGSAKVAEDALLNINKSLEEDKKTKEALEQLENLKTQNVKVSLSGPGATKDPHSAGLKLANFLFFGSGKAGIRTLEAPMFKAIKIAEKDQSSLASLILVAVNPKNTSTASKIQISVSDYKGAEKESTCLVLRKIYGNNSHSPSYCSKENNGIELMFPGIDRFIKIIKNSPTSEKFKLEQLLIDYNAYMSTRALLFAMQNSLDMTEGLSHKSFRVDSSGKIVESNLKGQIPDVAKDTATKQFELQRKIADTVFAALKELDRIQGKFTNSREIEAIFEAQEKKNRERGLKQSSI